MVSMVILNLFVFWDRKYFFFPVQAVLQRSDEVSNTCVPLVSK